MRDIRLEEIPFDFDGKTFLLRCNMNVLADVQDAFGGNIGTALAGGNLFRSVLEFLAAMLNDYSDEQGWPERYTARALGRKLSQNTLPASEIMGLVTRSIAPAGDDADKISPESETDIGEGPGNSGN